MQKFRHFWRKKILPEKVTYVPLAQSHSIMADATKTTIHPRSHMTYTQAPAACEKKKHFSLKCTAFNFIHPMKNYFFLFWLTFGNVLWNNFEYLMHFLNSVCTCACLHTFTTQKSCSVGMINAIGPLHDSITWYKITHTGMQVSQWNVQNKGESTWTGTSCFVLEVTLRNLHPSMCNSVLYDRTV